MTIQECNKRYYYKMKAIRDNPCPECGESAEIDSALAQLRYRIHAYTPDNLAEVPIAMMYTGGSWNVDVNVKRLREAEYEVTGVDPSLAHALRRAGHGVVEEERRVRSESQATKDQGTEG